MTIPLFCGDAGLSLLIRSRSVPQGRGMDSYGEEGRRQDSVAVAIRLPPAFVVEGGRRQEAGGRRSKSVGVESPTDLEPVNSCSVGVLNPCSLWSRAVVTECSFPPASCPTLADSLTLRYLPPAFLDKINHPVPLISENLQPALDEVFHAHS
ncbi:hypothetical protein [Nostoc sp.]|uniref:hypothetical protein n=2 Tax=Nostoc sp. TaxID=1180 RepID=UPI002FF4F5BD